MITIDFHDRSAEIDCRVTKLPPAVPGGNPIYSLEIESQGANICFFVNELAQIEKFHEALRTELMDQYLSKEETPGEMVYKE